MTSNRPYLLRAFYDWITDNQMTPYVLIDTLKDRVQVPKAYIKDKKITLNIAPQAVQNLVITQRTIKFEASFNGQPETVCAPVQAVLAIYASENGQGIVFNQDTDPVGEETEEDTSGGFSGTPPKPPKRSTKKKPTLTVVK
jgi:stringent starvation protein B